MTESNITVHSSDGFKKRLSIIVILLNLLVFSLAGISLYHSKDNYEKRASVSTQNIASILEHDIDGTMDNIDITLFAVKNEAEAQIARGGINKESLNRYIIRQHSYMPAISALRMTDAKGDLVYGTGLTSGSVINIADRDYFKFGLDNPKDSLFISKPIFGRVTNKWVINIARRVNNPDGSFAGIVFGSLTFNHLTKLFSNIDVGKKGSITLRDEELGLITRYPEVANSIGNKTVSKEFSDLYKAGEKYATFTGVAGIDQTERLISYRKMPEYPMVIVVAVAQDEYLADWRREVVSQLCLVAFFSLFTIFSSRMLLARWIREKENEIELRKANDELELRVDQRTADLNQVNAQLKIELTERRQAEESLLKSEQNFRSIIEVSPIPLAINDEHGNITYINKAFERAIGYTMGDIPTLLEWWPLAYPDEHYRQLVIGNWQRNMEEAKYHSRPFSPMEIDVVCKDDSVRTFMCSATSLEKNFIGSHLVVFYDITDLKRAESDRLNMEKQLLHTQKLESLGVLAGGIAHDFNNILMAIIGNADLALMRMNPESPAIDNLRRIEQAAARAADLAKQMLAYSGKGKFVVENLDLNILLEEMLHMLEVSISKKAVLRLNPTQHLPSVEADATQIRQIIMNLVINASEAIGDKSGVIAITTGCMDCDKNYLKDVWLDENLTDGLYVYLEIADSGCGMDKATMAKLFDPFFTTKFTGRGLGMAAVLGIVRGHKGSIKVYSELNRGTTFKILLPASNRPAEIFNGESHHDDWKGQGKVLLVDDEETVRGIGSEMLKELGFDVITAEDGIQALEQFKINPDITFVILDLTMPHMDGEQCFRELRQIKSDVKVVMSSGFSEYEVTQKFAGKGMAGFIQKPYKLSVLKEAIRKI